jgi:hypothetical protein
MSAVDVSGCVLVSLERLRALEALEAEMVTKKTAEEHDADRLRMLREHDKANPSAVTKRTMKHYESHKEEINAKRREAYKLKKAAETAKSPVFD